MSEKKVQLTEKAEVCLAYLKEFGTEEGVLGAVIAEATELNPKGIHGVLNSLVKLGLVTKGSKIATVINSQGLKAEKAYTTYAVTDAGKAFGADAE